MKSNTTNLLKFHRLHRRIGGAKRCVAGLLEVLWHGVCRNCPHGDIGKFTNEEIAILADFDGDADQLVDDLIETGWLDEHSEYGLVVHDWHEHAPNYVKGNVKLSKLPFADTVESDPQGIVPRGRPPGDADIEPPGDSPQGGSPPSLTLPSHTTPSHTNTLVQPAVARVNRFDEFWGIVHSKKGKGGARKAFAKAVKALSGKRDDPAAYLIVQMTAFAKSPDAHPTTRSPILPATWLNDERYDDDPETWKESGNGKPDRKDSSIYNPNTAENPTGF
jgi:hypothetical protein